MMLIKLRYLVIYLSLVACLILMILPVPDWVQAYRPNWVALVLIYWSMALPNRVGLWFAFFAGLLVDTLHGTLLGQNALALVVIMFINLNLYQRIRVFSLPQQMIYIFGLLIISHGIVAWVEGLVGRPTAMSTFFAAPLVGMLIWPWVFIILRDLRRKAMLG
ncbi:MAG: rod shape-determining protein MreD [Gammaproteobacteria bacterium]|nr:rod shape-determining protein MreD [Gammaproteobacteria bacterium]